VCFADAKALGRRPVARSRFSDGQNVVDCQFRSAVAFATGCSALGATVVVVRFVIAKE
jgi:hypothetical protein